MRVCFFGAFDPAYPRNRILRTGLVAAGVEVVEARVPEHHAFRRYPALAAAFARVAAGTDVVMVPEFRHKDVPLARLLAGRRRLVFDPLVSRFDTLVGDWGVHAPRSAQARWNRGLDRWALALADVVVCDTWAQGALYVELGARRERLRRILVGAEEIFFGLPSAPEEGEVRVLYVGGFLPLHGVLVLIEATARLERQRASLPPFRLTLVGRGIQFEQARRRVAELGLACVDFLGGRPYDELPETLASAHVVVGAFGTTEKARRVIPHKVFQGLAGARAVVTGDGPGGREVFEAGVHLDLVPVGDPEALSATLAALLRDPGRRRELGRRGRERAMEVGTPRQLGRELREVLEGRGASAA